MNDGYAAPLRALARAVILGAGLLWAVTARAEPLPATVTETPFGGVLERQELLAAVAARNPGLDAARQALEAARQRVPQAESLEDPMASYSLAPLSVGSEARLGEQLRLSQRLPFPGTLRWRGKAARAEVDSAGARVEQVRLELALAASRLYDRYYLVFRGLAINEEHQRLLGELQEVAASRYAAGLAPQQAPLEAEVEAAHLLHRAVVLETERRTVVARLNALLDRRATSPLPPPPAVLPLPAGPGPSSSLETAAVEARPEVREQRAKIAERRAAAEVQRLRLYPDFEAATSYNSMWNTLEHRWMIGASIRLPLRRGRIRAGIAEAEARRSAAESELAQLDEVVRSDVEVAAAQLDEALQVATIYRDRILPAARDQINAARAGFETGAGSMVALIDAERSLRSAELTYDQTLADASSRRAELDRALGRRPFSTPAGNDDPPTTPEATEAKP